MTFIPVDGDAEMVRVVVISSVRLYREGLVALLERSDAISVLGSAGDGPAAIGCLLTCQPDVALLDMAMPASLDMLAALYQASPRLKVVGFGLGENEHAILAAMEAGIAGYVLRRDSVNDLVLVVRGVAHTEAVAAPPAMAGLMRKLAALASETQQDNLAGKLTLREAEIVGLVAQGFTNKEIARQLFIQLPTVKNHVHNILTKLQLRHRAQAAALAGGRLDRRI